MDAETRWPEQERDVEQQVEPDGGAGLLKIEQPGTMRFGRHSQSAYPFRSDRS
jgi:hypothetical protein